LALASSPGRVHAFGVGPVHVTDGQFTSPGEWTGANVSKTFFPVVGQAGGAFLYVEQTPAANQLFLMYDYVNGTNLGFNQSNSFFDVFFEVARTGESYLVHITPGTGQFAAFEKPIGVLAPENPNGTFLLPSPVWTPLTPADLIAAGFHSAIGLNTTSPNPPPTPHLLAEFDLTLNTSSDPKAPNGFYDPAPAFWSASAGGTVGGASVDPPISSAIFTLNPNGSTTINPVLGPLGAPILQPQDALTPEPSSLVLLGLGGIVLFARARIRRGAALATTSPC
jgi:PEP-CTERM motif